MQYQTSQYLSSTPKYYNFQQNDLISLKSALNGRASAGANYFTAGMTSVVGLFNQNAAMLDILTRYGGGNWGIIDGLQITLVNNYININQGQIMMDGIFEYPGGTIPIPVADTFLYVDGGGNLITTPVTTPLTNTTYVYLGRLTVSTGSLIYDNSGVPFIIGGVLHMLSGDPFYPSELLPSNSSGMVQTLGGIFWWNGTKYLPIGDTIITWRLDNTDTLPKSSPIFSPVTLTSNTVVLGTASTNPTITVNFNVVSKLAGVIGKIGFSSTGVVSLTLNTNPTVVGANDILSLDPISPMDGTWQNLEVFVYALP